MTNTTTTRIEKAYFRNNSKFGRTTRLVVNGRVVLEVMGVGTKRQMVKQWRDAK